VPHGTPVYSDSVFEGRPAVEQNLHHGRLHVTSGPGALLSADDLAARQHGRHIGHLGLVSGQTTTDTSDGSTVGAVDARFGARVMIAAPGRGEDLDGPAAQPYAALTSTNFDGMTPKVLIVVGEKD
jgi:hypothetical protein